MTNQATTKEKINKLIEFRQAVYEKGVTKRKEAFFDLPDVMVCQNAENPLSIRQKGTSCDKNGLKLGSQGTVSA